MSVAIEPPAMRPSPYPIYRLTVKRYHEMIRAGIIDEDEPVELLEGCLVQKMGRNPLHDGSIQAANRLINRQLPPGWDTRIQSDITTGDSEPEPDIAVVRGDERTYFARHPEPQDIGLLVEAAETSLERDRVDKGRIYARARIACYWIINLIESHVEVYTDPTGSDPNPHYRHREDYGIGSAVPVVLDGQTLGTIPVRELLP
jgi:Uma2 family endonuclease